MSSASSSDDEIVTAFENAHDVVREASWTEHGSLKVRLGFRGLHSGTPFLSEVAEEHGLSLDSAGVQLRRDEAGEICERSDFLAYYSQAD